MMSDRTRFLIAFALGGALAVLVAVIAAHTDPLTYTYGGL